MKQSKIKDLEYNFIDSVYDFVGLWERDSKCGLKIVNKGEQTLVIVTELYNDNPGSSVTEFCAELANVICDDFKIDRSKLLFIQHIPEINSKLDFYEEVFDVVSFELHNGKFIKPDWNPIQRAEVEAMVF